MGDGAYGGRTWRGAFALFAGILALLAFCGGVVVLGWAVIDYIVTNAPQPYNDPEPPPTQAVTVTTL